MCWSVLKCSCKTITFHNANDTVYTPTRITNGLKEMKERTKKLCDEMNRDCELRELRQQRENEQAVLATLCFVMLYVCMYSASLFSVQFFCSQSYIKFDLFFSFFVYFIIGVFFGSRFTWFTCTHWCECVLLFHFHNLWRPIEGIFFYCTDWYWPHTTITIFYHWNQIDKIWIWTLKRLKYIKWYTNTLYNTKHKLLSWIFDYFCKICICYESNLDINNATLYRTTFLFSLCCVTLKLFVVDATDA